MDRLGEIMVVLACRVGGDCWAFVSPGKDGSSVVGIYPAADSADLLYMQENAIECFGDDLRAAIRAGELD